MNLTTRIALTGMALAGGIGPAPAQAQHPDLSGHWTFDAAQSDSTVAFTADTGAAVTLYGDGRNLKQTVGGAGDIEVDLKARWQGNDFVVERKVSGGGKVTEDYLRSRDGKQLFVIVSLDNGRGRSIEFRRVYDAVTS